MSVSYVVRIESDDAATASRVLEWLRTAVTIAAAVVLAALAIKRWRMTIVATARAHPRTAAFVFFLLMTIVQTWPLA